MGFCDDGRWVAEWEVPQPRADKDAGPPSPPITFQVTRYKSGETAIKYKTAGGFVEWSEKSGITMGALPAGVLQ